MIGIFRHKFIAFIFSTALFMGFGLKFCASTQQKLSLICKTLEGEQPSEEEKSEKDENSKRNFKKLLFFEIPKPNRAALSTTMALGTHGRVYLSLSIAEPLISIPVQPPEQSC